MRKEKLLLKIVQFLIKESNYDINIPKFYDELKRLYKALVNIRMPYPISEDILKISYLSLILINL